MLSSPKKVLIIDAEYALSTFTATFLTESGYAVQTETSGLSGYGILNSFKPDVILLDTSLPDIFGKDLICAIRKTCVTPIIVISPLTNEAYKVEALDAGADDYITKPFGMNELLARIRTALRHSIPNVAPKLFQTGELTIDFDKREASIKNIPVKLTSTEYSLICVLAKYAGKVITYEKIIKLIWGKNSKIGTKALRVNIANIRRKFSKISGECSYIHTESGVGYGMVLN